MFKKWCSEVELAFLTKGGTHFPLFLLLGLCCLVCPLTFSYRPTFKCSLRLLGSLASIIRISVPSLSDRHVGCLLLAEFLEQETLSAI